ncbi:tRNA (adenosine(37)-N6)-threonylcarbamoyltransferase complex ATPase subunit type 1 TsaE [Sphingobacterium paludis]|uniref:tRNA threonylcarbamoyladenosine biosynthesis protein TsaE n=1 Tax=Sphingobacterium paludis TaxID=1476465 RepID=A0A4R7D0S7_9SPHI|nr:tRNA (adenosine(37)-N6)-threonylcarbamoyltransferase complex ATPase subunit type 1 TsaE [Sphingobacterium paludis]TDS13917.1 tRNA threonylcarbamoyladenosine biosynthesis protein TsaE [Sphingobacterium paludis]
MEILVHSLAELRTVAEKILSSFPDDRIFLFHGEMGAGKTTLINALCKSLGVQEATSSPTFSIVNEYRFASGTVFHFDFYRLKNEEEALDLGYEEYFYSGNYCFVEWPEKIANLLPSDAVNIYIETLSPEQRKISIA